MKRETGNKLIWITLLLALVAVITLSVVNPAQAAGWSGSQTVTIEPDATMYTACLEYDFFDWWVANFTLDYHSQYNTAYDLSTTLYIPFEQHIYSTVGIRVPGNKPPEKRRLIPYLSVTYQF